MKQYLDLLEDVLTNGEERNDRTGVGTISVFDRQIKFDMADGFPAVTTKKLAFKAMMGELLWFMNGETELQRLRYRTFGDAWCDKTTIWDANQKDYVKKQFGLDSTTTDDCGLIYGHLWHLDNQFWSVVDRISKNPTDRRLIVNSWNPEIVNHPHKLALPPCHYAFQFYVREGKYLDLKWHQRSCDAFLGCSFNIASYAALLHIVSAITGLVPGILTGDLGDVHIYKNHIEQVKEQLTRQPKPLPEFVLPEQLSKPLSAQVAEVIIDNLTSKDFSLKNYECYPAIKAEMAV